MTAPEWRAISKEAKELIKKLLTYDPQKRIPAEHVMMKGSTHAQDGSTYIYRYVCLSVCLSVYEGGCRRCRTSGLSRGRRRGGRRWRDRCSSRHSTTSRSSRACALSAHTFVSESPPHAHTHTHASCWLALGSVRSNQRLQQAALTFIASQVSSVDLPCKPQADKQTDCMTDCLIDECACLCSW